MTPNNQTTEVLDFAAGGKPKLSTGLNVLTILTIIGSCLGIVFSILGYVKAKDNLDQMRETIESGKMDDAPGWLKGMIGPEQLAMSQKMYDNRFPIMLIGLVGAILCLYGALQMRKLKKQGYPLWLTGEILPIIGSVILIGTASLSGMGMFMIIIPAIFIILYTIYRKELIY